MKESASLQAPLFITQRVARWAGRAFFVGLLLGGIAAVIALFS